VSAPLLAGKEYSKADSRYATRDDFIISMEAVTAFIEGPVCLLIVWGMIKAKPWRYTAILMVSLGQFYGDVLYFGTCIHGGERGEEKQLLCAHTWLVCCLYHSTQPQHKAACIHRTYTSICLALLTTVSRCCCCCRRLPSHSAGVHLLLVLLCHHQRRVAGGAHGLHDTRSQEYQPRYCRVSWGGGMLMTAFYLAVFTDA
jgi:hypothetical protein